MPERCRPPGSPSPSDAAWPCVRLAVCAAGRGDGTPTPASSRGDAVTSRASTPAAIDVDRVSALTEH